MPERDPQTDPILAALDKIEALAAAATPGPRMVKRAGNVTELWTDRGLVGQFSLYPHGSRVADANAEFACAACNFLPALAAALRAAIEMRTELLLAKVDDTDSIEGLVADFDAALARVAEVGRT